MNLMRYLMMAALACSVALLSPASLTSAIAAPKVVEKPNGNTAIRFQNDCRVIFGKRGRRLETRGDCKPRQVRKAEELFAESRRKDDEGGSIDLLKSRGWTVLATHKVNLDTETDVVKPPRKSAFRLVRFCVEDRPVIFRDSEIIFGNGQKVDARVRGRVDVGRCAKLVDLSDTVRGGPDQRHVERIILRYETARERGRRATVVILAK